MRDISEVMNGLALHCEHEQLLSVIIIARRAPNGGDLDIEGGTNVMMTESSCSCSQ